jgi:hypothetical protein
MKANWKKQVQAMGAKGKLGGGGRFHAIAIKAAHKYGSQAAGDRVAAAIGIKKYGKRKMANWAEAARKGKA